MDLLPGLRRAGLSALLLVAACAGDPGPAPSPPPAPIVAVAPEAGQVAVEAGVLAPQAGLVAAEVQAVVPAAPSLAEGDVLAERRSGQEAAAASSPLPPPVLLADAAALRAALASRPAGAEIGFVVLDLETGQELAAQSPDRPLIPASTTKLATAVVALDVLGPEHRFRTDLLGTGPVRDGVLQGDLILRGDGDPTLDVADLLELAVRLATRGVRRVDGRFLIDDSALPRLPEIEPTQPLEAGYNPSIGALSLAFNRVLLSWRGGGRIDAATLPPLDEARFEPARPELLPPSGIELESAGDEDVVWSLADRGARRQEAALPVKDPGLHAGRIFRRLALAQGHPARPARARRGAGRRPGPRRP